MLDLDAYELLSLEESIAFRNDNPDSVLTSRFVDRWKPTEAGGVKAKSRIVIHGFKDPHVLQLERSVPTPTNEAFTSVMQAMASNKWESWSSDISNVFGQALKTNRRQPRAASLPPGLAAAGFG